MSEPRAEITAALGVVAFDRVPSECGTWPLVPLIVWYQPLHTRETMAFPEPTEAHFDEVLEINPALRGWGEPL